MLLFECLFALRWDSVVKTESESSIKRLMSIRLALGYTRVDFSKILGVPLSSYKNWEQGYKEKTPSSLLRLVLDIDELKPYFSFIVAGAAEALPEQVQLDNGSECEDGERIKLVRHKLGKSGECLSLELNNISKHTLRNYEDGRRKRIPCSLYEAIAKHPTLSGYLTYILRGYAFDVSDQKGLDDAMSLGRCILRDRVRVKRGAITPSMLFSYVYNYTRRAISDGRSNYYPTFKEVTNRFMVSHDKIEAAISAHIEHGFSFEIIRLSSQDCAVEVEHRGSIESKLTKGHSSNVHPKTINDWGLGLRRLLAQVMLSGSA